MLNGFECDRNKAELNKIKHGISFEEAMTVFYDDYALLGRSEKNNTLVVVHCERDENIRIISARLATIYESKQYKENL